MSNDTTSASRRRENKLDIMRHLRLVWRLLMDKRVSPWIKGVIPALAVAYLLLPWDLVADFVPVLGQLDDLAVLVLGMQLFIELCPKGIVQEHLTGKPSETDGVTSSDEEIIDAHYRVVQEEEA